MQSTMSGVAQPATAPDVPITAQRPPPVGLAARIPHPEVPRANKAVSAERPDGSPIPASNMSVMQQHAAWFDRSAA
jgi:peroxygenase